MNSKKCHQFEERMNDLLDRRLSVSNDPILNQHALHCSDCDSRLETQARISECISYLDGVQLASSESANSKSRSASFWFAAAAVCLAIVSVTASLLRFDQPTTIAQLDPPVVEEAIAVEPPMPAQENSNDELDTLYAINSLATSLLMMDDLIPEEITQRIEQAADPIRPLTNSVSSTISVLRRTIPVGTKKKFEDPHTSSLSPSLPGMTDLA